MSKKPEDMTDEEKEALKNSDIDDLCDDEKENLKDILENKDPLTPEE